MQSIQYDSWLFPYIVYYIYEYLYTLINIGSSWFMTNNSYDNNVINNFCDWSMQMTKGSNHWAMIFLYNGMSQKLLSWNDQGRTSVCDNMQDQKHEIPGN